MWMVRRILLYGYKDQKKLILNEKGKTGTKLNQIYHIATFCTTKLNIHNRLRMTEHQKMVHSSFTV